MQPDKTTSKFFILYILSFLLALNAAFPTYIGSSFLSIFTTEQLVGLVYVISSIATVIALMFIPKLLRKEGSYRVLIQLLLVLLFSLLGLSYITSYFSVIFLFITSFVAVSIIWLILDIIVESYSKDSQTGNIRGFFLTSANIAWVFSPLIIGFILSDSEYWKIYLASAIILLPVLLIVRTNFKDFKDPIHPQISLRESFRAIKGNKDLSGIFTIGFLLQFFYAWMVIYTPIYLHNHIGLPWSSIGIAFAIMLLPFVFIEIPLGKLADSRFGEKEMLVIGFIIMSISTALISFVVSTNVFLWGIMLFITRIGASMIEIMSETYFFKKIDAEEESVVSLYRTMRPWAYIAGPVLATLFLVFFPFKYIFLALAIILLWGIHKSLALKDTL